MTSVAAFLPPSGPGRVLITSQNSNWHGHTIDVPVLDQDVAADFLISRTGDPDQQAALDLATELGGLPLALEQAAAYTRAIGGTLVEYLDLFRHRRAELLARGEPTGYSKTVASAWALAFDRLQQTEPGAVGLLRLLAFCAPETIPLHLLLQLRPGAAERFDQEVALVLVPLLQDPLAAKDAIAALRRYSLISPPVGGSVSVHRLVQAITVDQMPYTIATQWRQAAATVIETAIPPDTEDATTWPVFVALLAHAQTALTFHSDGMGRIAAFLGESGSHTAARAIWKKIVDARAHVLGHENPDTLYARGCLAWWTGEVGDPGAARDLMGALLPINERVLGLDHPETLDAHYQHARFTGMAGDPAAARDLLAANVSWTERVLGVEHPDSLIHHLELAHWTGEAGDPVAARDQYADQLPIRARVLGPDHPYTLAARFGHAIWTGKAGNPGAARDLITALLPVRERVLGPNHPYILSTRAELAHWTGEAGNHAGARDQYVALLPVTSGYSALIIRIPFPSV